MSQQQQQQQQQQPPGAAHINARVAQGISGLFGQSLLADCQLVFVQERPPPGLGKRPHGGHGGAGQRRYGEPLPAHSFVLRFASDKIAAQVGSRGRGR